MVAQPQGGDLRGLKALVGVLGALVILGTALVIGVVIHRLYAKPTAASISAPLVPGVTTPPAPFAGQLPAGDTIKAIATAGAGIAIWVNGPTGDAILLADPATGKITTLVAAGR